MLWLLRRPIDGHPSPDGLIGAVGNVVPPAANRWRHVGEKGKRQPTTAPFSPSPSGPHPPSKLSAMGHMFFFSWIFWDWICFCFENELC